MSSPGGWSINRAPYSERAKTVFEVAITHRRANVQLLGEVPSNRVPGSLEGESFRGRRFKCDADILARLETMFTEREFMDRPAFAVDKALADAASADYYYEFLKDYGCEVEDVHEDDGVEDGRD